MGRTGVVFAGGDAPRRLPIPPHDFAVAADSGLHVAVDAGIDVDLVVGDFDSVEPALAAGIPQDRYPVDKDATDLELAVAAVISHGCKRLVVIGAEGGRLSHLLGAVAVLAAAAEEGATVEWLTSSATAHLVIDEVTVRGKPGDLISLIPTGGDATGVTTEGLRWPLHGETLLFGSSRGVSNELAELQATVTVGSGLLAVVHEEPEP